MVQVSYPGVYIEEVPSGVRTITGVATSIALFIGRAGRGPLNKPVRCYNYSEFVRSFTADARYGEMPQSVRLFFENGGTQCYALRIARGAAQAAVTLQSEASAGVLTLTAKEAGVIGETIRAAVTYSGAQPEMTFNLELFRWEANARGEMVQQDREYWPGLSMDPDSPRYAEGFLKRNSRLVEAAALSTTASAGLSRSGRPVPYTTGTPTTFRSAWGALIGKNATDPQVNRVRIKVGRGTFTDVDLSSLDFSGITADASLQDNVGKAIADAINAVLPAGTTVQVSFVAGPTPLAAEGNATALLQVRADGGDVVIEPYPDSTRDLAVPLMLGTAQGGLEVSRYSGLRPAPTGITFLAQTALVTFGGRRQDALSTVALAGQTIALDTKLQTVAADRPMYKDNYGAFSRTGNSDGVREKLAILAQVVNDYATNNPTFRWRGEVSGQRLSFLPAAGGDNEIGTLSIPISGSVTGLEADFLQNVRLYSVGVGGTKGRQTPGTQGTDGSAPDATHYRAAYEVLDREVDLFNLLVLPRDKDHSDGTVAGLWSGASVFCQRRRALLLMDPPESWAKPGDPVGATAPNVTTLRVGLVKDYAALFYPRLYTGENGLQTAVGPSGAIAGLMARTDATRGVWKAPAGTEADLRGILGLALRISDGENGALNQKGVNAIRAFPVGIVNWGARTMDGDDDFASEWKYIPVRRLALYIEESLYRGTQWAVFEPNDEPLWAQLRLNIGAFMHGLFRQGAFMGKSPRDAYLVKCDSETTTQDDVNLGIVNILVGFAPLKPAEFVVIRLQQKAGQVQV